MGGFDFHVISASFLVYCLKLIKKANLKRLTIFITKIPFSFQCLTRFRLVEHPFISNPFCRISINTHTQWQPHTHSQTDAKNCQTFSISLDDSLKFLFESEI